MRWVPQGRGHDVEGWGQMAGLGLGRAGWRVGVVVAATIAAGGCSGESPKADSAATTMSAHQVCMNQLGATTWHLANVGYPEEVAINGDADPVFDAATHMMTDTITDRRTVGDEEALARLRANVGAVCSQVLHDAIRPNYPTDGTYPGQ